MNWGEVKTAALQKMFLSSSDPALFTSATKDYIGMMPAAANEGLMRLAVAGRYIPKSADVTSTSNLYDLKTLISDLFDPITSGIMKQVDGVWVYLDGYDMLPNYVLRVHDAGGYTIRVPYYAYPQTITTSTTDNTNIAMDKDGCALLALYIASELFKEDDIGLATQWRNEFEVALGAGREDRSPLARVIGGSDI